jgi:hypothetical protein
MAFLRAGYIAFAAPTSTCNMFKYSHISLRSLSYLRRGTLSFGTMTDAAGQKTYHKKASGSALATVRKHSKDHELKLFGSCFW